MAPSLDNLGWFYRGKADEQASAVPESLNHKIVYLLLASFTATGFLVISFYVGQLIRLILSLCVLRGKPVC